MDNELRDSILEHIKEAFGRTERANYMFKVDDISEEDAINTLKEPLTEMFGAEAIVEVISNHDKIEDKVNSFIVINKKVPKY